ncbi:MAG TPA: hypothetical protein VHV77_17485 [Pirellulales bacterium]|jgi:hypothetical protein|nr:hypothetical protein [Pirellulales bacterium]
MSRDVRVWHHVILTGYGAWPDGDARGFRTRRHRQHVDGDYKNPPPAGKYAAREKHSRLTLKQSAVEFSSEWRPIVGTAVCDRLREFGCWVLCVAAARQHVHLLVKIPAAKVRAWIGRAKMHATFVMHEGGWQGKVWAVRCKVVRIRNRAHQMNTFYYICDHVEEGAWVGVWKDDVDRASDPGPAGPGLLGAHSPESPGPAGPGA